MGLEVRLTTVQWAHILDRHPEMDGQLDKFLETLREPDAVPYDRVENNHQYVRRFRKTPVSEKSLLVIARHAGGDGFVFTAFFVARIRLRGKELVHGDEAVLDQLR